MTSDLGAVISSFEPTEFRSSKVTAFGSVKTDNNFLGDCEF